jgi:hypothetical protein
MKTKTLFIVLATILLLNVVGYAVFRFVRPAKLAVPQKVAETIDAGPDQSVQLAARLEEAKARRAAGVVALEAGNYVRALINLTEAKTLGGDDVKVDDLLRITSELRAQSEAKAAEEQAKRAPEPSSSTQPTKRIFSPSPEVRSAPRVESKPKEVEKSIAEPPAATPSETGILLVSTTPRGLLVQIDGVPADLTPMRVTLKAGTHRVALFDGDKKLYETGVDVVAGTPTTVLRDVTAEMTPKAPTPIVNVEATKKPVVLAAEQPASPTAQKPETVTPAPQTNAPTIASTGGLIVTSPGLYGEVWVSGRPRGFPPVTVTGLAPGPVTVEVRVNGLVKRSSSVIVEAGQTQNFRIVR